MPYMASFVFMNNERMIEQLLEIKQTNNAYKQSTIIACLKSARFLCSNGLLVDDYSKDEIIEFVFENGLYHSNVFSGVIFYLIFLDQVGNVFKPKNKTEITNKTKIKGSEIHKALKYFSTLNDTEIGILRELRNSLVHQFSLATDKRKFVMSIESSCDIIKVETEATIYIPKLIELAESIFEKLLEEHNNNNLEIVIKNNDELFAKFFIKTKK